MGKEMKKNITQLMQDERLVKIDLVTNTIKRAKSLNISVEDNNLVLECCSRWGVSLRYAKELVKIARWKIKNENS